MQKFVFLLVGASLVALAAPSAFERYKSHMLDTEPERVRASPEVISAAAPAGPSEAMMTASSEAPSPAYGRTTRLAAGSDGHFRAEARINGRPEPVLVDTGATYVSISESTARRLGISLSPADFRYKAQTANGETPVAVTRIDRLEIGRVEVRDVEAMVSKGDVLPVTLLGMSFLKKLKRFEVQAGTLNLVE